jgi:two-component system repressor protein LuxO
MSMSPIIFIVEDVSTLARTYKAFIGAEAADIRIFDSGAPAVAALDSTVPNVVLLDIQLPDMHGLEVLREIKARGERTEVIVVTGQGSINLAVEAMREGAFDFLVKPCSPERLRLAVRSALEKYGDDRPTSAQVSVAKDVPLDGLTGFFGESAGMQIVFDVVRRAAVTNATVFITGESGTGKELCAQAIHGLSKRKREPLVAVNCAAIPRDLLESELFGHVKGAFTGAIVDRKGAAMLADGGTLFLDEICEMNLDLQAKLLRFLQERTIQRVGESGQKTVDVRVICATNRDPLVEVAEGRLREDLFYRLYVVPIELPPLRHRQSDILLIARQFLNLYATEDGKEFRGFSAEAERALISYDWPGNVRQLQNIIRNVVVLNDCDVVEFDMLPKQIRVQASAAPASTAPVENQIRAWSAADAQLARSIALPFAPSDRVHSTQDILPLEDVIRRTVERAITACGGSIPRAAGVLQVSPSTIYRRVQGWQSQTPSP